MTPEEQYLWQPRQASLTPRFVSVRRHTFVIYEAIKARGVARREELFAALGMPEALFSSGLRNLRDQGAVELRPNLRDARRSVYLALPGVVVREWMSAAEHEAQRSLKPLDGGST